MKDYNWFLYTTLTLYDLAKFTYKFYYVTWDTCISHRSVDSYHWMDLVHILNLSLSIFFLFENVTVNDLLKSFPFLIIFCSGTSVLQILHLIPWCCRGWEPLSWRLIMNLAGGGSTNCICFVLLLWCMWMAQITQASESPMKKQNHLYLWQRGTLEIPLNGKCYWASKMIGSNRGLNGSWSRLLTWCGPVYAGGLDLNFSSSGLSVCWALVLGGELCSSVGYFLWGYMYIHIYVL